MVRWSENSLILPWYSSPETAVKWPFENSFCLLVDSLQGMAQCLPKNVYLLWFSKHYIVLVYLYLEFTGSNFKIFASCCHDFVHCYHRGFSLKRKMFLLGDTTMFPVKWKLRLLSSDYWLFTSINKTMKRVKVFIEVIDPEYQGKWDYYFTTEIKKNISWSFMGLLNIIPYLVIEVNGKVQTPN